MIKSWKITLASLIVLAAGILAMNARAAATAQPSADDVYIRNMEAKLADLGKRIKTVEAKLDKAEAKVKQQLDAKLADLKLRKDKADKRLAMFKTASADSRKVLRHKLDMALEDAEKSYNNLVSSSDLFVQEQKDEYVKQKEEMLSIYNSRITKLENKIAATTASTKSSLENDLKELKAKRDLVRTKLDEIKTASLDKWKDLKDGLNKAKQEMVDRYDKLKARLK